MRIEAARPGFAPKQGYRRGGHGFVPLRGAAKGRKKKPERPISSPDP